jgi:N-acetylglucosaminyldiphosphoundecaprenol N-acetyl-beta-D-mannosaminyltransferase
MLFVVKLLTQFVGQQMGGGVKVGIYLYLFFFAFAADFYNFTYGFHRCIIQKFLSFGYKTGIIDTNILIERMILMNTNVTGLKISNITKLELLDELLHRLQSGQKTFVSTPYSEFLYRSLMDPKIFDVLNKSDFAVPDGIGIFWAAKFLSIPLTAKSYYGKILQAFWQAKYSLAAILFYPKYIRSMFKERISGSDLVWDLVRLAVKENQKIYLLGGFGDTAKIVANKFKALGAEVEYSSKNPTDPSIINEINGSCPRFLFVAYGPIRQEQWIVEHMAELPCKLYIGLGGTFDYIAQKQLNPPRFMRIMGLEWLFRLVTQPFRAKRIWQATFGLVLALMRFKVFTSMPYRNNVVSIVLNDKNEVLICRRNPADTTLKKIGDADIVKFKDYWQFSQGGVDGKENLEACARRELAEEMNIKNISYIKTSGEVHYYDWRSALRPLLGNYFKFRGQKQHIIYFKFTGQEDEIKPDQEEFIEYKWIPLNELIDSVHDQRKELARIAIEDLKDLA